MRGLFLSFVAIFMFAGADAPAQLSSKKSVKSSRKPASVKQVKKTIKKKKPKRFVKRSKEYRKNQAEINQVVDDAFAGSGDKDNYPEPTVDVGELEIWDN